MVSVFIVGVALDVVVPVRFVTRLLVKVFVLEIDGITTPSIDRTPAEAVSVFWVACPSSILVPTVRVVPMFPALAAEIPPDVRMAPVVEDVVSSVDGAKSEAEAPVPPIVSKVVAPAKAVNEVEAVVTLVVIAGEVIVWTPVNVCAASVLAMVAVVVGKVIVVLSVPVRVSVLFAVSVFPLAIVSVAPVAGAVKVTLFIVVAVATPNTGVTKVGVSANTNAPDPVSSEITPLSCSEVVAAN